MKKLLTICLLLATTFTVKAQELNFEETVNYINDIFKENRIGYHIGEKTSGRVVKGITADKTGKVIIYDLYKGASEESKTDKFDVIMASINLFDVNYYEKYNDGFNDNYNSFYFKPYDDHGFRRRAGFFNGISAPVSGRLKKALYHLISLCNKQADPFGN